MTERKSIVEDVLQLLDRIHGGPPDVRRLVQPDAILDEDGKGVTVLIDLPGFTKEQVEVKAHEGLVLVRAERPEPTEEEKDRYLSHGRYEKVNLTIPVPEEYDMSTLEVTLLDHGVLSLHVKPFDKPEAKTVEVK